MPDLAQRVSGLSAAQRKALAERLNTRQSTPRLRAFVTLRPDSALTPADLRSHLEERLPAHALPAAIEILESLPRLPNGKLDRDALAAVATAKPPPREPAGPHSDTEETLLGIWREVLDMEEISIHDDFFEIGGDSILSIQIISRARSAGLQIAPQDFDAHTTIAQLAEVAGGSSSLPSPSTQDSPRAVPADLKHIVPIQTAGSRPPLFCMHSGGDASLYRDLAKRLGPDFPVFGIQAIGLDGGDLVESIEEVAGPYLEEIKAIQPEGPYCLLGNCFGAAVGLEIAHLLNARGEEVGLLVVVDSAAPVISSPEAFPSIWAAVREANAGRIWRRFKRNVRTLVTTSAAAQWVRRQYLENFGSPAQRAQERFRAVHQAYLDAFYRYDPAPYRGPVVFFQGTDSPTWSHDALGGWKKLAPALSVEDFACTHREFLDEPHVQSVAQSLARRISEIS